MENNPNLKTLGQAYVNAVAQELGIKVSATKTDSNPTAPFGVEIRNQDPATSGVFATRDLQPSDANRFGMGLGVAFRKPYKVIESDNPEEDYVTTDLGKYMKHSDTPNCYLKSEYFYPKSAVHEKSYLWSVFLSTAVPAGTELTFDHNTIPWKQTGSLSEESYSCYDRETNALLLLELHEGLHEFSSWLNQLEASQKWKTTDDATVKQFTFSIAQENILTTSVKEIIQKIAQFVMWLIKKIVALWKYFFGAMQRNIRTFKSNNDKIKARVSSNAYFNLEAFRSAPAPSNLIHTNAILDIIEFGGWDPDKFFDLFKFLFDNLESDPIGLTEKISALSTSAEDPSNPLDVLRFTGFGRKDRAKAHTLFLPRHHIEGAMKNSGYDSDAVEDISERIARIILSYEKITKMIDNAGYTSSIANRILAYGDRVDVAESEATAMATKMNMLGSMIQWAVDAYNDNFSFILEQGLTMQKVYMNYMK